MSVKLNVEIFILECLLYVRKLVKIDENMEKICFYEI